MDPDKTALNARVKAELRARLRAKSWVEKVKAIERLNASLEAGQTSDGPRAKRYSSLVASSPTRRLRLPIAACNSFRRRRTLRQPSAGGPPHIWHCAPPERKRPALPITVHRVDS
jgi:hypothetical protein